MLLALPQHKLSFIEQSPQEREVKRIAFLLEKQKYSIYQFFHLGNRIVNYAQPIVNL